MTAATHRPFVMWPDKRLRTAAAPVAEITNEIRAIWDEMVRMANPEILHSSIEDRTHEEASPNLPGVSARLERPRAVTVRFLNQDGAWEDKDFVGLWATSVQHQIDHLNGRMYFDNLSRTKRDMLLKKARKLR